MLRYLPLESRNLWLGRIGIFRRNPGDSRKRHNALSLNLRSRLTEFGWTRFPLAQRLIGDARQPDADDPQPGCKHIFTSSEYTLKHGPSLLDNLFLNLLDDLIDPLGYLFLLLISLL